MTGKDSMTATSTGGQRKDWQRGRRQHALYAILGRYSLVIVLALLVMGFSLARPESR